MTKSKTYPDWLPELLIQEGCNIPAADYMAQIGDFIRVLAERNTPDEAGLGPLVREFPELDKKDFERLIRWKMAQRVISDCGCACC